MKLFDRVLLNQILALRYAEGVTGVVAGIVLDLGQEIERAVKEQPTDFQSWRLAALANEVKDLSTRYITKAKDAATDGITDAIPVFEQMAVAALNEGIGVSLAKPVITDAMIQTIASNEVVLGQHSAEWWARQPKDIQERFITIMRTGIAKGETVGQMVTRLQGNANIAGIPSAGAVNLTRAQAEALVRTSVANANNLTKLVSWQKGGAVKAIQWVATLDNRTTPICRALDGKRWDIQTFEPIGHDFPFPGPTAHWNCRSTQVPVMDTLENLATKNKDLARWLDEQLGGGTRAAAGMEVPRQMSFGAWLKAQPQGVQKQILGASKWRLWSSGKVTVESMVSADLRPLTLKQLKALSK